MSEINADGARPMTADDFFEHHGIKGMKWGVRKDNSTTNTTRPKMSRNKKIAVGVGVGAVAVGAIAVTLILKKNGTNPVKTIAQVEHTVAKGSHVVSELEKTIGKMTMAEIDAHSKAYWSQNRDLAVKLGLNLAKMGL